MIPTIQLPDIYKPIQSDLELFKKRFAEKLVTDNALISAMNAHLLTITGKHLRSALTLMSARLGGDMSSRPVEVAVVIELLHNATLVHDDIVDASPLRRNQASLNSKWGSDISVIYGDFIYAKTYEALSQLQDHYLNNVFTKCAVQICVGEINQLNSRSATVSKIDEYLNMIEKKTAILFQVACAAGAHTARMSQENIKRLSDYGRAFGMLYQISDDCLDMIGDEAILGKKAGTDVDRNDPTLPLIYLSEAGIAASNDFEELRRLAISEGAIQKSIDLARQYADEALRSIDPLPENVFKKSLAGLIEYTLNRLS